MVVLMVAERESGVVKSDDRENHRRWRWVGLLQWS